MVHSDNSSVTLKHVAKTAAGDLLFRVRRGLDASLRSDNSGAEAEQAIAYCKDWMTNYMGKPHAELGRKGDICPFVVTSMKRGKMSFHVYPKATRLSAERLSELVIHEGLTLKRRLNKQEEDWELTALNLLLPKLDAQDYPQVDEAHTLCKTLLMRRGMMVAVCYPEYQKPGFHNPDFKLYQAKFPVITLRPMALHDIVFVENNPYAFQEYRRRFVDRYRQGKVSARFGYIERFEAAEKRHGYA